MKGLKEHVKRHLVHKDGQPVMVMRPTTEAVRQRAIRFAQEAVANQTWLTDFSDFMAEVGADAYQFVGYLALGPNGVVVDENGKKVGRTEMGDSFITEKQVS